MQDGFGTANTALIYHANKLLALHEGDLPYAVSPLTSPGLPLHAPYIGTTFCILTHIQICAYRRVGASSFSAQICHMQTEVLAEQLCMEGCQQCVNAFSCLSSFAGSSVSLDSIDLVTGAGLVQWSGRDHGASHL